MTITIELTPRTEARLRKRATGKGQDLESFLKELAEREANFPEVSLAQAAEPLYEWTRKQGYAEDEIEQLVDDVVAEVRDETPLSSR
ncbi:MAG: hypothetical protein AB7F88_05605 [Pyrinomonadaceae bacterium]